MIKTTISKEGLVLKNQILDAFKELKFDEESHTYKFNNKELLSTTTYIKKFEEEFKSFFPSEAKAKGINKKHPDADRTGTYYRRRWNYIRDEALNRGNRVHLYAECYPYFDIPICNKEQGILDFYDWIPDKYEVIISELKMYDEDTYRAGTTDGVLHNKETGGILLFDFKTNERHLLECYGNKKLKTPFKKLMSTSLNKYSIQLSDYHHLLNKKTGLDVEERWIVWLTNKKVNVKDKDRNANYKLDKVKADIDGDNFKIFKVKDYSTIIAKDLQKIKKEFLSKVKTAKISKSSFSGTNKKKDLRSLIAKNSKK